MTLNMSRRNKEIKTIYSRTRAPAHTGFTTASGWGSEERRFSRFLVTLAILALVHIVLDAYLFYRPSDYAEKANLLRSSTPVEILILGSSHSLFGIRPDKLKERAINLANVSQSLSLDEQIMRIFLRKHPELRLVVVPVSYFSLDYCLSRGTEEWRDCLYFRFLGVHERSFVEICKDARYWSLPVFYGSGRLRKILSGDAREIRMPSLDSFGWCHPKPEYFGIISQEAARARVKGHQGLMFADLEPKNKQILVRLIDACLHQKVKVLLITLPVFETYLAQTDPNTLKHMRSVLQQFGNLPGVKYVDYLADPRFGRSDFADNDHLNENGAAEFSSLLDQEVIGPLLGSSR